MNKQSDVSATNHREVLDHGFVRLVDHMGTDAAIVQAARVSYGAGTKTVNEDRGLIRYLMRHQHTTPLEMCVVKIHAKAPILAIRQWMRHRSGSFNEQSFRYSEMSDEFYVPDLAHIQPQSSDNKQGRAGELSEQDGNGVRWLMAATYDHSHQTYKVLLGDRVGNDPDYPGIDLLYDPYSENQPLLGDGFPGIAREIARSVMPVASYSEFYWKVDLKNLFDFLRLRSDPHAQYEIRVYAEAIIELVRPLFPLAFEAWEDYSRSSTKLSRMDTELIVELLLPNAGETPGSTLAQMVHESGSVKNFALSRGMSIRELREIADKFGLGCYLPPAPKAVV